MTATAQPQQVIGAQSPVNWRSRVWKLRKNYTVRVLTQGLLTIWTVITFTFFLIRLMPGSPLDIKVDQLQRTQGISYPEALARASLLLGYDPDKPVVEQYFDFVGKLLHGDLGLSVASPGVKVLDQIRTYLPWTLFSAGLGVLISFSLGVICGLAMAYWRGGVFDNALTVIASILYGIPDYIIPLLLIIVVGVQWGWFSPGEMRGGVDPSIKPGFTLEYIGSILKLAILPILTYVLASVGGWILTMKSSTLSTLGEDYINVAKARGLGEWRILTGYVGRNALLPLVTRLAINIGLVIGNSVVVEELFQYPGIGRNLLRAINARDYTTMQGMFIIITIAVVMSNILADLLFGVLDPRVRLGDEGDS